MKEKWRCRTEEWGKANWENRGRGKFGRDAIYVKNKNVKNIKRCHL